MSDDRNNDRCDICKRGKVITRNELLAFHQWTSRGYISCSVTVPVGTCSRCGAKSWDDAAEKIIEQAFQQEYNKRS